jgi:hypothetical protein
MALLVYSDKCKYSLHILDFIKAQPALSEIIRFHNVTTHGRPHEKITMVPTLVTNEGVMKVGGDIKPWLESMVPFDFDAWDSCPYVANLDGTEEPTLFEFENYGLQLQPEITAELEAKISTNIADAMATIRTNST